MNESKPPAFTKLVDESKALLGQPTPPRDRIRLFKIVSIVAVGVIVLILGILVPIILYAVNPRPTNLIIMISDGCGPASYSFARQMTGTALNIDQMLVGTVQTSSSDSLITDSAAGATAYSCALRTYNGAIAVDPSKKPCGTLLEAAKAKGMRTGLVATSRITHATPASFSAHVVDRDMEYYIAQQQITVTKPDLMFGGGLNQFTAPPRPDGVNLLSKAQESGYQVILNQADFEGELSLPILGLFANSHMSFEIDRDPTLQPSLAQMTQKALDLLQANSNKGFFLMIEGSRIDMAAHNNDPGAHYREILAYDQAVQVVLNFVKQHPETTVIGVSDHETGGLSLGRNFNNYTYPTYEWSPQVVSAQRVSAEAMSNMIKGGQSIVQVFASQANIVDLTQDEINALQNVTNNPPVLIDLIGNVISYRARIGWSTWGHTAVDINLYVAGDQTSQFKGNYLNTDIGSRVASIFGFDLGKATSSVQGINPVSPYSYPSKSRTEYHD